MAKPKGSPKSGGRKKGTPNKMTREVREAFEEAVAVAQGKEGYSLADWATRSYDDNAKFWLAALKTMPKEIKLDASTLVADVLEQARKRSAAR